MINTAAKPMWSLAEHFVKAARRNWSRRCISDSTGKRLNYGRTLLSVVVLARKLDKITRQQQKVGILLPPSVAAALANLAVTFLGKVSGNLKYVVSEQLITSAVEQCGIETIISSRRFVEKLSNCARLPGLVFLEDIATQVRFGTKIKAYLKARFMPLRFLTKARCCSGDDLVTIIFSSGTTGQPKGVMLSHRNIFSNIEALQTVFDLRPDDNLCGVLPFFHSFGFTCSLWLPVLSGVSASYAANPLDAAAVGRVAGENRSSILFAVPTFLANYIRRAEREDFTGLRAVIVGAEKLKKCLADSFERKFGIRPLEGYGTTELSPVVSLNLPEGLSRGSGRAGFRQATVGRPIPGVQVKIVHPESGKPMAVGQEGLLMVKGPNVMLGYLNKEEKTAEVLKDGWYNTGDIASIDADGFLTIAGRLSRFSKIAGEMVPHLGVEQTYLQGLNTDQQLVAVTSVPARSRGEELIVLYLEKAGNADKLHDIIAASNLPNMWKPRRDNYIRIESMPTLGSGKLDVVRLREIASAAKSRSSSRTVSPLRP